MKKIAGVVVWYNPTKKEVKNIETYLNQLEVLYVIDNSDHNNEKLLSKNDKIKYLPNYSNLGISYALNKAAKMAIDEKYEFLLTMDQDSSFTDNNLTELIKYAVKSDLEKVAIISPKHLINVKEEKSSEKIDNPLEVMTSGNLLNLNLYQKIGEFKEEYFIDDVDIEYGLRLNKMGYRIDRLNEVTLKHHLGNIKNVNVLNHNFVCSNHSATRRYYMARNTMYLCDEYAEIYPDYCDFMKRGLLGQIQNIILFEPDKINKLSAIKEGFKSYKNGVTGKHDLKSKVKSNWLFLVIMFIIFFACSEVITWDSAHYLSYVNIFEGIAPIASWDIVRGPVFPFIIFLSNSLFGKTTQGIMITQFLSFTILFFTIQFFLNKLIRNGKHKTIKIRIIEAILLFNPIILGYYHVLLTEFVAITLMMFSLMVSYFWFNTDSRKNRAFCSLYFLLAVPFSYYLKQPYICCTLLPFGFAFLVSIIRKFDWHKVANFFVSCLGILLLLVVLNKSWNNYLISNGVNMNTGRDTSSIFAKQLLNGVANYSINNSYNFETFEEDNLLSDKEKDIIRNTENKSLITVIDIVDSINVLERDIIIANKDNNISSKSALIEIASTFIKYPNLITVNYIKNYCALSSICNIGSDEAGVMYYVADGYDFINSYENDIIAGRVFKQGDNTFTLSDELYENAKYFKQSITPTVLTKIENNLKIPTNIIYKLVIIAIPISVLSGFIVYMISRSKLSLYYKRIYFISMLLLLTSLFGVMANALSGSVIDRYTVEFYIPSFLGNLGMVICTIEAINKMISNKR